MGNLPSRLPKGNQLDRLGVLLGDAELKQKRLKEQLARKADLEAKAAAAGYAPKRLRRMFVATFVVGGLAAEGDRRRRANLRVAAEAVRRLRVQEEEHKQLHELLEPEEGPCPWLKKPTEVGGVFVLDECLSENPVLKEHVRFIRQLKRLAIGPSFGGYVDGVQLIARPGTGKNSPRGEESLGGVALRLSSIFTTDDIGFLRECHRPGATLPHSDKVIKAAGVAIRTAKSDHLAALDAPVAEKKKAKKGTQAKGKPPPVK